MRALASCALVVAALSCKSHKSLLDDTGSSTGASSGTSEGSAATKSVDAPPKPAAVTSTRADPQIHELGMEHVVPSAIMLELATPIVVIFQLSVPRLVLGSKLTLSLMAGRPARGGAGAPAAAAGGGGAAGE